MPKELKLIPPSDPRVLTAIAPFEDGMLKEHGYSTRKELADDMLATMRKYGGIGLTCNQVGLPFNMFVAGGHPQVENGRTMICFNPKITKYGDSNGMIKEGCLSFPFLFLNISRPRSIVAEYENEKGEKQEAHLYGLMARVYQHEYDHTLGRVFTEKASKFKLDLATKKAEKMMNRSMNVR